MWGERFDLREEIVGQLKRSARRLVQGPSQADGELVRYRPRAPGKEKEKGMNGILVGAPAASSAGKDLPPSDSRANGMLSAQAQDFPAAGQQDPKGVGALLRYYKTEVTTQNSFLIPHNPAPWNKSSETHSLREYDFCGSPGAWVASSKSSPPSESAKRACATLPARPPLVAHAHCKILGVAESAPGRLRKRARYLPPRRWLAKRALQK